MRIEVEFDSRQEEALNKMLSELIQEVAADTEAAAKLESPVNTGLMRAMIHYSMVDPLTFVVTSGVFYDVFFETGTRRHFVPFMTKSGAVTSLGHWAMKNLGYSEDDLRKKGGFIIQIKAKHIYASSIKEALQNLQEKYGGTQ